VLVEDFAAAFSGVGVVDTDELAPLQSSDATTLGGFLESEVQ
jgi:hypothetical protein